MLYQYEKFCHASQLDQEINNSSITKELESIQTEGSNTSISFLLPLSVEEKSILDELVQIHAVIYPELPQVTQPVSISNTEIDDQGRQVMRSAAGQKGWSYFSHPFEFETSKLSSLYCKDYLGNDRGDTTVKYYNASGVEVTSVDDEALITKTVLTWSPNYDYELISGSIRQIANSSSDVRVWVIGGIVDLGGPYVKEFAGGLNLRYIGQDEEIKTDGRAAKYMKKDIVGVPYSANKIQIIVKHDAGIQHKLMIMLEYFRA